jgi:acetyl esterase
VHRSLACSILVKPPYTLDPELADGLSQVARLPLEDPVAARKALESYARSRSAAAFATGAEIVPISGPEGSRAAVRRFLHGGGFIFGVTAFDESFCAGLASDLNADVFLVDYSLAPEHPFPAALNDCFQAFLWLTANSNDLGVDPDRIGLVGKSAGACLAIGVSLLARDQGIRLARAVALNQPVLDDRLETPSMRAFTDTPVWNRRSAELTWSYYLGPNREHDGPYAVPARTESVASLPQTFIATAEFDPLRDEGVKFASRLQQSGNRVALHEYPGTFHGSDASFPHAAISQRQRTDLHEWLRTAIVK